MNSQRRKILKAAAATAIAAPAAKAATGKSKSGQTESPKKKVHYPGGKKPERKPGEQPPPFSGAVSYGNLLFIAGKGAHKKEGDIKAHTKIVLDEIEKELVNAGSSMEKVLKCNVYLAKAEDYGAMNEVFRGRFGEEPPVRTTIAAAWIPGDSLVE